MHALKQFAAIVLAFCLGSLVSGCQPSDPDSPRVTDIESIAISPNPASVKVGGMQSLNVVATLSDGSTYVVTFDSTFASNATGVATVSSTGRVTGVAAGSATITATHTPSGKTATVPVTVAPLIVESIAATPAVVSLATGASQQITVTGTFDDGSTGNVTAGSTFVSSDTDVATVSATGLVQAVAEGPATITATHTASGETATVAVTVSDVPAVFTTIDFESAGVTYTLTGFGGAEDATVVTDPTDASNTIARVVKSDTAELWAGTTVSTGPANSVDPIPFTATGKKMTVRVYSPRAGIPVRLKVEDASDNTRSVETEATTTVANAWETLTFDFGNQVAGTAALNLAYTYNKISIFFDFGTTGAAGGGGEFWFDDVTFVGDGGGSGFTTISFDSAGTTYTLTGFGGAEDSTVVTDPTNAANKIARVVKSDTAELWAGTTVSTGPNNSVEIIPFTATGTKMTVRVYSPRAGIPVRLKVEDAADNTRSVETEATTTAANAWQTLTFDFANQAAGTAALNLAYTYNKISIFFDFGTTGAAGGGGEFWFDDVTFTGDSGGGGGGGGGPIVFASGYASDNRTVEGGEWGFYSGNFTSYANTFAGGGFVDGAPPVAAADSYVYLVVTTSAPTTDGFMGIYTFAPGSTGAARTAGVSLVGKAQMFIEIGVTPEWLQQGTNNGLTVRLIGNEEFSNGAGGFCRILLDYVLTPSIPDLIEHTISLDSLTVAQGCNGGGFNSGVTNLQQALARPIGEVHVQAVYPRVNTTVLGGTEYPTGFTRGSVRFE